MPTRKANNIHSENCTTETPSATSRETRSDLKQQLKEANFISRFMGATSATLDPQDICAIASRHIYDFAPFNKITFSLSTEFGLNALILTPSKGENGQAVFRNVSAASLRTFAFKVDDAFKGSIFTDQKTGERVIKLILPEKLGTVQIHFNMLNVKRFSTAILSEVTAHFARTLKNALTYNQIKETAMKDCLTGLFNRRFFDEFLTVELGREELLPISLLILDLDDFKKVNDTFGHPAGDEVLTTVSRILKEGCRGSDLVARYGGEEFAIMLPETTPAVAFDIAQRLRARLAATVFHFNGQHLMLTASIGIAYTTGTCSDAIAQLISRADKALYMAKRAGKNMTEVYATIPSEINNISRGSDSSVSWLKSA